MQRNLTLICTLVATSLGLGLATPLHADVFKSVDAQGTLHLSNVPTSSAYKVVIHAAKPATTSRIASKAKHKSVKAVEYSVAIKKAAQEQNLDQALLKAVIHVESGFNPQAVSSAGAVGLMQLMPATAKRYGAEDRYNPVENIQAGARYLHDLISRYNDNLPLALAAYNAGENAVAQYGNHIPPYAETRDYVPHVLNLYQQYRFTLP